VGAPDSFTPSMTAPAVALPHHFIESERDRRRQIERPDMWRHDRHTHKPVSIALVQLRRQAGGLTAEDENNVARLTKWRVPEESLRLRRKEVRVAERRKVLLERIPAWPNPRIDVFPVVETRTLHLTFIQRKAKRSDEVKSSAGGEACTARVSSVPVNFGMYEYHVRRQLSRSPHD